MRVLLPTTVEEACALMREDPTATPLAGGTDLMVHWPRRHEARDRTYLDLSALEAELRPLRLDDDALVLGALTTYWDVIERPDVVAAFPLLDQAARQVGAVQIQARGTWAGNVVNASPAADGVPVLMAYGADVELVSHDGVETVVETVPLDQLYTGYKTLRRRPDQLVRAIRLSRRAYAFERFDKVGSRRAQAITKVGLAMTCTAAGRWRVVASSVAPTVQRCPSIEAWLSTGSADDSTGSRAALAEALQADVAPIDDVRSTARYRARVLQNLLAAAATASRLR